MSQYTQGLSFIIPCHNEQNTITRCLSSIVQARISEPIEIIVVDNQSIDCTASLAKEFQQAEIIVLTSSAQSVAAVRNEGAQRARYDVLVFIDGDIELSDDWYGELQPHMTEIRQEAIATGSHVLEPTDERCFPTGWYDQAINHMSQTHINSAHFILAHALFDRIQGFDETLRSGEDYDVSKRIEQLGIELRNNDALVAYHYGYPKTLSEFLKREAWHGVGDLRSLAALVKSKVALLSVAFILSHLLVLVGMVLDLRLIYLGAFSIIFLCLVAAFHKYKHAALIHRSWFAVIFYLYFVGRTMSTLKYIQMKTSRY